MVTLLLFYLVQNFQLTFRARNYPSHSVRELEKLSDGSRSRWEKHFFFFTYFCSTMGNATPPPLSRNQLRKSCTKGPFNISPVISASATVILFWEALFYGLNCGRGLLLGNLGMISAPHFLFYYNRIMH